jgi:FHA domain
MDPKTITKVELAKLLREAEKAHAEYEKMLGSKDEDWPDWYADFIVKKLQKSAKSTNPLPPIETIVENAAKAPESVKPISEPVKPASESIKPISVEKSKEGEKVEQPKTALQICPTCAHANRPGVLFCDNCGTNLTSGAQAGIGTRDLRDPEPAEAPPAEADKLDAKPAPIKLDTTESKAIRSAGSSRFENNMTLRIEIEGGANPIILKPKTHDMILGRRDPTTGATPEVDLTPYAGYRMGVSRKHSSLRLEDNQLNLWDLGSSNGTFINGTRLNPHRPYPVRDGDEIRLGQMVLRMFFQTNPSSK